MLTLLEDRIAPGAIVVFDELVNYPAYREHEVKALWEWLSRSRRSLEVIGISGPLVKPPYPPALANPKPFLCHPKHQSGGREIRGPVAAVGKAPGTAFHDVTTVECVRA